MIVVPASSSPLMSSDAPVRCWISLTVAPPLPRIAPTRQLSTNVSAWPWSASIFLMAATHASTFSLSPETVHSLRPRTSTRTPWSAWTFLIVAPPGPIKRRAPFAPKSNFSVAAAATSSPATQRSTSFRAAATCSGAPDTTTSDAPPLPASTRAPVDSWMKRIVAPPAPMTAESLAPASTVDETSLAPGTWPASTSALTTSALAAFCCAGSPVIVHVDSSLPGPLSTDNLAPVSSEIFLMVSPPLPMTAAAQRPQSTTTAPGSAAGAAAVGFFFLRGSSLATTVQPSSDGPSSVGSGSGSGADDDAAAAAAAGAFAFLALLFFFVGDAGAGSGGGVEAPLLPFFLGLSAATLTGGGLGFFFLGAGAFFALAGFLAGAGADLKL
mmetsp:Transcript_24802/g.76499  ORF Transcript_24802/g.76499 Transcript_24802/m.76499 type:complete len:383 (+) Transcript_24802:316-1464(+)